MGSGGINSNFIYFSFFSLQTQNDDVAPANIGPADRNRSVSLQSTYVTMLYNAGIAEGGRRY